MLLARRIVYYSYRLLTGIRYRARRRFTPAGLAVVGGAMVGVLLSANIGASLAYQILAFLLCLLVLATLASRRFRGRFIAQRRLPRFGTVGSPLSYPVFLRNDTPRPQTDLFLLEDLADPRPGFREFVAWQKAEDKRMRSFSVIRGQTRRSFERARIQEQRVPPLAPGQETEVRFELLPLRRGALRFTGVTVARPEPLGLMKAFVGFPAQQTLLVLPKRYPLPPIAMPGLSKYQKGGVALASSVGQSEEFVSLRDYRHGDPLRRIHWRSWAKAGKPIVKEFEDEFFVRHALILDTFTDHPHSEVFEEAVSVAASFACTLQTQESLLDLLFVGPEAYCFTSGRGLAHREQMLEILASVQPCSGKEFEVLERLVWGHLSLVSGCVCVFIEWNERRQKFVKHLRQLGIPLLVLVIVEPVKKGDENDEPFQEELGPVHKLTVGKIKEGLTRMRPEVATLNR